MPTLAQRVREFVNSARGKQLIEQGRRELAKPANRQKMKGLVDKLRTRRTQGRT